MVFPRGTILLGGDIGSGKTSLLLSIEFALFGLKASELTGSSLLRHGTNEGFVELEFSLESRKLIIKRFLKRKSGRIRQDSGYVVENEQKTEMSALELKSFILKVLGYPEDLVSTRKSIIYRYTVYTPQEEMKRIITEKPEVRLQTLRKIFNIDKYKLVRENASMIVRELKSEIREIQSATEDLPALEAESKKYEKQKREVQKQCNQASKTVERLTQELEEHNRELGKLENKRVAYQQLLQKLTAINGELKSLEGLIQKVTESLTQNKQRAEEIKQNYEELKSLKAEQPIAELKSQIGKLEAELAEKQKLANQIEAETQRLAKLEAELSDEEPDKIKVKESEKQKLVNLLAEKPSLIQTRKELANNLELLTAKSSEINSRIKDDKRIIAELESASVCPLCGKPLTDSHKRLLLENSTSKNKSLKLQYTEIMTKLEQLKAKQLTIEHKLERMNQTEAKLSGLNAQLAALKEAKLRTEKRAQELVLAKEKLKESKAILNSSPLITELKSRLESLRLKESQHATILIKLNMREKLKAEHMKLAKLNNGLKSELEKLKQDKDYYLSEQGKLKKEVEQNNKIEEEYARCKAEQAKVAAEEKLASLTQAKAEKELESLQEYISSLEEKLNIKRLKLSSIQKKAKLMNWLESYFSPLSERIERHVMLSIYQEFNELFVEWFNMLMEDENLQVRLDEEFSPLIMQNGYESLVENLSGGERTSVALAYRLALNKVVNDVNTSINTKDLIILDEPTEGFSSDQLDNVRKVIDELNAGQVIIVSHEPKIESFVDHIILISKQEGLSHIKT